MLIHYSEYATERITFHARYFATKFGNINERIKGFNKLDLNPQYKENTISFTVPKVTNLKPTDFYIRSYLLKLRKIQYINISCNALVRVIFEGWQRTKCMDLTIFYS